VVFGSQNVYEGIEIEFYILFGDGGGGDGGSGDGGG